MKIKSELKLLHSKDLKMKKATKFLKPLDKNLEWFDFTCQFSKIEEFGLIPIFKCLCNLILEKSIPNGNCESKKRDTFFGTKVDYKVT